MPDDPNKKGRDRKFVSQQPHEQAYQKRKSKEKGETNDTNGKGSSGSKRSNDKPSK